MTVLRGARSSWQQSGWRAVFGNSVWSAGLVFGMGFVIQELHVQGQGILLGYAIAVLLAGLLKGKQSAGIAVVLASILGAISLPPVASFYIDGSFRGGYGLFLILCILISFYRPPRNSLPVNSRFARPQTTRETYTEADLPTIVQAHEERAMEYPRVVAGQEIYRWQRACAHLSDLIWDAQVKLQENDSVQAYALLQHAYAVAAQTRQQICTVDPETGSQAVSAQTEPSERVREEGDVEET